MSSRRIGDIPESVNRLVIDDQAIMRIFLELVYGKKELEEIGADGIIPTLLYRLCELNERSSIAEDFLLREIHRVYRPKEFFTRLWLRDLYMAARIRALVEERRKILVICGAAHTAGIYELLQKEDSLLTPSLCSLIVDQNLFLQIWRDVLKADLFVARVPQSVNHEAMRFLIIRRLLVTDSIDVWTGTGWTKQALPVELLDEALSDQDWCTRAAASLPAVVLDKIFTCHVFTY